MEMVKFNGWDCIRLTNGKVDLDKLQPVVFDAASMTYRAIGKVVGKAWGEGKKFTE